MKSSKTKAMMLTVLIVAVIGLAVAFAALSSNLTINGIAKLDPINWDIHFDNISGVDLSGDAAIVNNPEIDSNNKTKITNFNVTLKKPWDKVTFTVDLVNESEDFYVIKDNGDTVTALARYNLMVGNKIVWDEDFNNILSTTALSKNDRDYGLQSELTKVKTTEDGLPTSTTLYGFISFAEKDGDNKNSYGDYLGYWTNMANSELGIPLEKYGTSYPANVFDENSLLWEPIQNYKSYFTSTLSKFSVNMRMITYSELLSLGCDENKNTCTRDFVYNGLNYWSATAHNASDVWYVHLYGNFFSDSDGFWKDDSLGLRPVITINKSEI